MTAQTGQSARKKRIKIMTTENLVSKSMTQESLRAWQARMGYTYNSAAAALGVSRATWANWLAAITPIDRRTALACAAIEAKLQPLE